MRSTIRVLVLALGVVAVVASASAETSAARVGMVALPRPVAALTSGSEQVVAATFTQRGFVRLNSYEWDGRSRGRVPYRAGCSDGVDTDSGFSRVRLSPISAGVFATIVSPPSGSSNFGHGSFSLEGRAQRRLSCGPYADSSARVSVALGAGLVLSAGGASRTPEGAIETVIRDALTQTPRLSVQGSYDLFGVTRTRVFLHDTPGVAAVDWSGTLVWKTDWNELSIPGVGVGPSANDGSMLALGDKAGIRVFRMQDGAPTVTWANVHWSCACLAVFRGFVAWIADQHVYVRSLRGDRPVIFATLPRGLRGIAIVAGPGGLVWAANSVHHGNLWFADWSDVRLALG